jgi:uncharacterized membrane protein
MPESWRERIRSWLRLGPRFSGSFDPAAFERLCANDPSAARDALTLDQRELMEELGRTYAAYREKLETLAVRVRGMDATDIRREAATLRDAHDSIRRTLRRIDVSARSAKELEDELREWESRHGEGGPRHADHPDVRLEIVRSELQARGRTPELHAIRMDESPFGRLSCAMPENADPVAIGATWVGLSDDAEGLPSPDPEHLVQAIRQMTREIERGLSTENPEPETVDDLHELRSLHAALKRLDRERGSSRDRLALAVRMR